MKEMVSGVLVGISLGDFSSSICKFVLYSGELESYSVEASTGYTYPVKQEGNQYILRFVLPLPRELFLSDVLVKILHPFRNPVVQLDFKAADNESETLVRRV